MKTIVIYFLLLVVSVKGQDSIPTTPKNSSLLFGYSAQSTYRTLKTSSEFDAQKKALDTLETNIYGQTFSVLFERKLGSTIRLQTGLRLAQFGEQTKTYLQNNSINYRSLNTQLAIPLFFGVYTKSNKNISFSAAAGFELGYLIASKSKYNNDKGSTETVVAVDAAEKSVTVAAEINTGIRIPLTDSWQFIALLNHRRFLQSSLNGSIKKYPYASGLHLAFAFSF